MDDLTCRCSYFEPHMSLQGLEVPWYLSTSASPPYYQAIIPRHVLPFAGAWCLVLVLGSAPRQVPMTPTVLGSGYLAPHPQFRPTRTSRITARLPAEGLLAGKSNFLCTCLPVSCQLTHGNVYMRGSCNAVSKE